MENFIVAFNVVLPVFLLICLGYLLQNIRWVTESALKEMNKLVFKVFLPVLLFQNMYNSNLNTDINLKLIIYAVACILTVFCILCIFVPRVVKERSKISTTIQGIYRSNFALFGIALAESMYGAGNIGPTGILVAVIVPLFNVLAVCLFEFYKGDSRLNIRKIIRGIITNPLIISTALGLVCNVLGVSFHTTLNEFVRTVGSLATPIALIVLGGTFSFHRVGANKKILAAVTVGRLIIFPGIIMVVSILLGFREKELFALYLMAGSPTAVASFAMASAMGGDGELAGQIVVVTTVLSLFTSIAGIYMLRTLGVI